MKTWTAIILLLISAGKVRSQVVTSRDVNLSFYSRAPIEDITAKSNQGVSGLDFDSKSIYFRVAIRTFEFEKKLMQEHFNENYLESSKYPNAEFKGTIKENIDISKDGTFPVTVQGDLNIHNVTKNYTVKGELKIAGGKVTANATFPVKLADHQIKIPRLVIKNIAEVVEVTVLARYSQASTKK